MLSNMFKEYRSMGYNDEFINKIKKQYPNTIFYVTEKIHGSNFSIIIDDKSIIYANRTQILKSDEYFYNYQQLMLQYEDTFRKLYNDLKQYTNATNIQIYGELAGGGYPHKDVIVNTDAKLIQKGIYYSPNNFICIFDILVDNKFLDLSLVHQLCEEYNLIYSPVLFKGTLDKCLEYSNEYYSKLAIKLMNNQYMLDTNICEGNVIRPNADLYLSGGERVMIKNKNEKWLENNRSIDKKLLDLITNSVVSDDVKRYQVLVVSYITVNRLNAVLSKLTDNEKSNKGKVLGMFNKDVITDFIKDYPEFDSLDKSDKKLVTGFINEQSNILLNV